MSLSETELSLVSGERYTVRGTPEEVESEIIAASRGSIMQFAWLTGQGGEKVGVNPTAVVSLRAAP